MLSPRPEGFPPGPAEDVAPAFLADPLGTLEALEARYGGVVGVTLGGERVVVVGGGGRAGARAAADVLLDPRQSFAKAGTAFFPGSDVTGNGLLTSDGDSWRRQRALATPAFRRAAVEAYGAAMAREAEEAAGRDWRSGGGESETLTTSSASSTLSSSSSPPPPSQQSRDLYSDFNSLTLRVVTTALFGSRLDDGEGARVASAVDAAFTRFAAAGVLGGSGSSGSQLILELLPEWFPGGGGGGENSFKRAVADLDEVVYEIIASRRRKLEEGKGQEEEEDGDGERVAPVSVRFLSFPKKKKKKQMTTSLFSITTPLTWFVDLSCGGHGGGNTQKQYNTKTLIPMLFFCFFLLLSFVPTKTIKKGSQFFSIKFNKIQKNKTKTTSASSTRCSRRGTPSPACR